MHSTAYKKQEDHDRRSLTQQKLRLFTCVAPYTESKGLPIGGPLLSKNLGFFICVASHIKSKGLPIDGPLLSRNLCFFTCIAPRTTSKGLPIDAPHIFYYFQHVLYRVQKARGSIGMCSEFINQVFKSFCSSAGIIIDGLALP
jgi:hypothetical protein